MQDCWITDWYHIFFGRNPKLINLRTVVPFTRINNDIHLNKKQWNILNKYKGYFDADFQDSGLTGELYGSHDRHNHVVKNSDFLNQGLVYLITESYGDCPHAYFTEKTWKAFVAGVPFMMIGPRYSLQALQELGFKTFNHWWNEDYDNLPNVADRIEAVVKELEILNQLTEHQTQDLCNELLPVLEYNRSHYKLHLQNDLDRIRNLL